MSIDEPEIDTYPKRVDSIDRFAGHVERIASNRHVSVTCRFAGHIRQSHQEHHSVTDFDAAKPYNELPELPPPAELIETKKILKQCISARVALAELKQAAELIPNAAVLVNALPLLEAQHRDHHRQAVRIRRYRRRQGGCRDQGSAALPQCPLRGHQDGAAWHALG
jgi:hypothetical protein